MKNNSFGFNSIIPCSLLQDVLWFPLPAVGEG